jgi:HSP20 family protein
MALTRHDPLRSLLAFDGPFFRAFDRDLGEARTFEAQAQVFTPPVDIHEDDAGITLKVELPEVAAKDVDIRLEGNTLTLKGERKLEKDVKPEAGRGYTRIERWYGSFLRSFTLPSTVDAEHVSAESKDGILRIYLPKKAETRSRQIRVTTAGEQPSLTKQ